MTPVAAAQAATNYDREPLPYAAADAPESFWPDYFSSHRPEPRRVFFEVEKLNTEGKHEQIIRLIQAAVLNGQSQPWMYEVLAVSMEIQKRPQAEIERVVASLADFGTADFATMSYSAAYLVRLGRDAAGLRLYREASRMLPEQPEPYILGLKLARKLQDADAIGWGACGVLRYCWTRDYKNLHREAENAAAEGQQLLVKAGRSDAAAALKAALAEARRRDLVVRLQWSGEGDLDLLVEEPSQTVCSFQEPATRGGGVLVHDGYGPRPENTYEEYVCAEGLPGEYRIRVRHAWGQIVGKRATLTVVQNQGGPGEKVATHSIQLGPEEAIVRVELAAGRRRTPRTVALPSRGVPLQGASAPLVGLPPKSGAAERAAAEFVESREQLGGRVVRRAGAVVYQPVVQVIPDGVSLTAQPVVSADRRYVRLGVAPLFSNITDVFTFSFVNGSALGNMQPGNPPR